MNFGGEEVRIINDEEEDARFNNNMFNLNGRDQRGSTKIMRIDDNSSHRFTIDSNNSNPGLNRFDT